MNVLNIDKKKNHTEIEQFSNKPYIHHHLVHADQVHYLPPSHSVNCGKTT